MNDTRSLYNCNDKNRGAKNDFNEEDSDCAGNYV
jgi:hypothetical protein